MTKTRLLIGFVCLALLAGAPARATTVLEKSFAALVQEAEIIAVGSVTAIAAEWDADRDAPFTLVTFSNLDILKGAAATPLTLRFLGGPTSWWQHSPDCRRAPVHHWGTERAVCGGQRPLCGAARWNLARGVSRRV